MDKYEIIEKACKVFEVSPDRVLSTERTAVLVDTRALIVKTMLANGYDYHEAAAAINRKFGRAYSLAKRRTPRWAKEEMAKTV